MAESRRYYWNATYQEYAYLSEEYSRGLIQVTGNHGYGYSESMKLRTLSESEAKLVRLLYE